MGINDKTTTSSLSNEYTQSRDVWYSDGSLIIVTEALAFRVHTTIMAAHCEIFRDMVNMPQPKDSDDTGEKTYEGCPVLELQDPAIEMRHFLKAIYEFSYVQSKAKAKFPVVAAVLRLSTKYQAHLLRQRAIDILQTAYPTTLAAWDNRVSRRLVSPSEGEVSAVIALAVETDARSLLPAAYYAACKQPTNQMFTEFEQTNLRLAAQLGVFKTFAVGKEKLREAEIKHLLHFLDPSFQRPGCLTNNDVTYLQSKASQVLPKTVETEPYQEWCSDHPAEVGSAAPGYAVCQNCCRTIEESIKQGREKIWQLLPTFFGLPSWEILTADDDESGINSEE